MTFKFHLDNLLSLWSDVVHTGLGCQLSPQTRHQE
jgi:hypothetical protein